MLPVRLGFPNSGTILWLLRPLATRGRIIAHHQYAVHSSSTQSEQNHDACKEIARFQNKELWKQETKGGKIIVIYQIL